MEVLDGIFKGVQGDMWLLNGKNGLHKANSGEIVYSKVLEARLRSRAAKRKGYPQKKLTSSVQQWKMVIQAIAL